MIEPNDVSRRAGEERPEPAWRRYLRFWRTNPAADVEEELQFHLDARAAEFRAAGMTDAEARRAARERFGDVTSIAVTLETITRDREATMKRTAWVDEIRQDFRFAVRQLLRSPGFSAIALLTLALGIGANTAIFSVVYRVLLAPLPYANGDRLLGLREPSSPLDTYGMPVTLGNYGSWTERSRDVEAFGAWAYGSYTLTGAGDPQRLSALRVTAGYWKALYIPAVAGRYFGADEDRPGAPNVVVLSEATWRSTFGGDPSIVGRVISLNDKPFTIVGVAPASYALSPYGEALFVPLGLSPSDLANHGDHELSVVALVRRGVTMQEAVAELTRIEADLSREFPRVRIEGIIAKPLKESITGPVKEQLVILFAAVGLVLLIACVNVANLLLARAAARRTELAVRGALGAGRARIVRQLLVESVVLAGSGGIGGLLVATAGVRFLVRNAPLALPRLHETTINGCAATFALALAVACGICFGLVPALRATRLDLQQALREGGRGGRGASDKLRAALVGAEVMIALVLLVGAGLLVRSAILLQRVPLGFDTQNLLVASTALPEPRYPTDQAIVDAWKRLHAAVAAVPGVHSAALVSRIPIGGFGFDCMARIEGSAPGDGTSIDANLRTATPNYFATIGLPLLRGRPFTDADAEGGPPVVVINRGLAQRLFGSADPLGKRLSHCDGDNPTWRTVIGVTGDMHARGPQDDVSNEVYYPAARRADAAMFIVVRGAVPVTTLVPDVRRAVASVDPLLALAGVNTMETLVARTLATPRFNTLLLLLLGSTGLVLAAVGIYGVISYLVTQRTQEIGIRIALGADAVRVTSLIVRQGLVVAGLGVAAGLVVSLAVSQVMASLLFGVSARDPLTFIVVGLLLLVVAAVASFIPAWRAAALDPLRALRST